jgi:hypothetical protein
MSLPRVRLALLLAAITTLALVGCAPAVSGVTKGGGTKVGPPTVSHPTAKPTRKPITPALDTAAPAARVNIPCNTLVPPSAVTGYQGSVPLIAQPALAAGDLADATNLLPAADYIRQAGGIQCLWAAGPVDNYLDGASPVPALLEVTVQFDAASTWPTVAQEIGAVNGSGGDCDVDSPGSVCQTEDLVNGTTWIEIYSRHAVGAGEVSLIEDAAIASVKAAGTPSTLPTPQTGTLPLGTSCTALLPTTAAATGLGVSGALTAAVPDQGQINYDLENWVASQNLLNDHPCVYSTGATAQATLAWIPGGAWAWAEDKTQSLANSPLTTLSLTGLHVHDGAWIRCASGNASCTVDLVLGGNWIEATVPASSTAGNKRTAATALAQAIVGTVG